MSEYQNFAEVYELIFKEKYKPLSKWRRNHPIKLRGKWKQRPNNPEVFLRNHKKHLTK